MINKSFNELISIILPVYNGEKFIRESIDSCLNQTYSNIELVIVNDGSTDNTMSIINDYKQKDKRIKIINNKHNLQLPESLNVGHKNAKGNIITWTSDDNIYHENAISTLLNHMLETDCDIVFSAYDLINENGDFKKKVTPISIDHPLLGNCIGASFIYKRVVFDRNDGYNKNLHTVEDYDFWLRAMLHSTYMYVDEVLYKYRTHKQSLTAQVSDNSSLLKKEKFEQNLQKIYQNFFDSKGQTSDLDLPDTIYKLSRIKKIDIIFLVKNYKHIKKNIKTLFKHNPNTIFKDVWQSIDLKIRKNMFTYYSNQNIKTLLYVLRYKPQLLLKYDRRRSIRYFINCIR